MEIFYFFYFLSLEAFLNSTPVVRSSLPSFQDAIHKIRYQKQRPNLDRVCACIRMHHPQYSNEAVQEHLDLCVENGTIQKVRMRAETYARTRNLKMPKMARDVFEKYFV